MDHCSHQNDWNDVFTIKTDIIAGALVTQPNVLNNFYFQVHWFELGWTRYLKKYDKFIGIQAHIRQRNTVTETRRVN